VVSVEEEPTWLSPTNIANSGDEAIDELDATVVPAPELLVAPADVAFELVSVT